MPRVTVITSTYNYASALRCAITSVLAQTFTDFEHLAIGDGCTDDSGAVVASFNDPRLHWHNLEINNGSQSAPNNYALSIARGDYIAYLGHDDLWHPSHLEKLVQRMDDTQADWVYGLVVLIGPPGTGARRLIGLVPPNGDARAAGFMPTSVLHKRNLIDKIGGWRDYRTLATPPDADFFERAKGANIKFAHNDNLSAFRFPAAWRKNVYVEKPFHEQAAYLQRMQSEPNFIENEWRDIARSYAFDLMEKWYVKSDVPRAPSQDAPLGAEVESWRQYKGLMPNKLMPRPWWEIARRRARRGIADATRPVRMKLRQML